jgi:hypothetical protein
VIGIEATAVILLDQRQPVRKMPALRNAAVVDVLEDFIFFTSPAVASANRNAECPQDV